MQEITSISNNKIKYVKSLAQKKFRSLYCKYTVEGIKSVGDALKSDKEVSAIYVSESFCGNDSFAYPKDIAIYKVSDSIFLKMCDTKAPQGILAVVKMAETEHFVPEPAKAYIYCDRVNDPGNLGTIIRTADAAGFGGVILSPGCADLYSPKTVRASMGSFFNMQLICDMTYSDLLKYKTAGFSLIGGALDKDACDYRDADYKKPAILIVGNEANGISCELLNQCEKVKIPIIGKAESLNAAVAASILMYELVRQRS